MSRRHLHSSPAPAERPAALFEDDARLSQAVNLEAVRKPLSALLSDAGQQTGVALSTEGEAADLRGSALVAALPLRQVMGRISTLFHLSWRRAGTEGQPPPPGP